MVIAEKIPCLSIFLPAKRGKDFPKYIEGYKILKEYHLYHDRMNQMNN